MSSSLGGGKAPDKGMLRFISQHCCSLVLGETPGVYKGGLFPLGVFLPLSFQLANAVLASPTPSVFLFCALGGGGPGGRGAPPPEVEFPAPRGAWWWGPPGFGCSGQGPVFVFACFSWRHDFVIGHRLVGSPRGFPRPFTPRTANGGNVCGIFVF